MTTTLLLLSDEEEEEAETDGDVETERMASATAPKYARGGSDLRTGRREGVLASTSASAA
jgi:hypothetical protein